MLVDEMVRSAEGFARAFRGKSPPPGDRDYARARRVHNAAADRHPALIVRPIDAEDVALVIAHARETGLPLIVRAGGHSMANHSTGDASLVPALSAMRGIEIA